MSDASLALPVKTIVAETGGANISLPSKTIVAGSDGANNTLPVKTISSQIDQPAYAINTLPLKVLFGATPVPGNTADIGDSNLPLFGFSSTALAGETASLNASLPLKSILAGGNHSAYLGLPLLETNIDADTGNIVSGDNTLPMRTMLAGGNGTVFANADNPLPILGLSAAIKTGSYNTASLAVPVIRLTAAGEISNRGVATLSLPALSISFTGGQNITATASLSLPMLVPSIALIQLETGSHRSWVVNLRTGALSEYQQFNFNSYAEFNDLVLAADGSGLYSLGEENLDGANQINAVFRTGITGFDTSRLKRVPRIYLGYRADGPMEFSTITTHDGPRTYRLTHNGNTSHHQRRIPVGRGPKSTYWQFQVNNKDGSDFGVNSMVIHPLVLGRRSI